MDTSQRIAYLILRQLKDELGEPESLELQNWLSESEENRLLYSQLTSSDSLQEEMRHWYQSKQSILAKIREEIPAGKVVPMWRKWVAAASIIVVLATSGYFLFTKSSDKTKTDIAKTNDIKAPSTNRATITLADGRKVFLDSIGNGTIAKQENTDVKKLEDGKITYQSLFNDSQLATHSSQVVYNTLTNPRGSRVIDITLSDGSRIWLNAESSITYPVAFTGNERKVAITGEAYFEVAHDKSKPFKVSKGDAEIEVLGTHFNVNVYDDEPNIKVTLLEGRVKVSSGSGKGKTIKPGQQVVATHDSPFTIHDNVDLEAVMAWKNGRFVFAGSGVEETLREIARWYDVDVEFQGKPTEQHFGGDISRNVEASKVFQMLENTGALHVKIEGRKIIVLP